MYLVCTCPYQTQWTNFLLVYFTINSKKALLKTPETVCDRRDFSVLSRCREFLWFSLSQSRLLNIIFAMFLCMFFSCAVSLIKTIINYFYWPFDQILLNSRKIHINILVGAEPEMSQFLWFSFSRVLPQPTHVMNPIFGCFLYVLECSKF